MKCGVSTPHRDRHQRTPELFIPSIMQYRHHETVLVCMQMRAWFVMKMRSIILRESRAYSAVILLLSSCMSIPPYAVSNAEFCWCWCPPHAKLALSPLPNRLQRQIPPPLRPTNTPPLPLIPQPPSPCVPTDPSPNTLLTLILSISSSLELRNLLRFQFRVWRIRYSLEG